MVLSMLKRNSEIISSRILMAYFAHVIVSLGFMLLAPSKPPLHLHEIICRQLHSIIFSTVGSAEIIIFASFVCRPSLGKICAIRRSGTNEIEKKLREKVLKLSHNLWLIKFWTLLLSRSYGVNMNLQRNISIAGWNMHVCGFMHNLQCKKDWHDYWVSVFCVECWNVAGTNAELWESRVKAH